MADPMTVRLIRAVCDVLDDGDTPMLLIEVGDREIKLSWGKEPQPSTPRGNDDA
jgi:hypothetical protein